MIAEALAAALAPFVLKHGEEAVLKAVRVLEHHGCMTEAAGLITGDRKDAYGKVEDSFAAVALVWSGLLANKLAPGAVVSSVDVALLMVGLKLARETNQGKRDNVVDAHGYLGLLAQMRDY